MWLSRLPVVLILLAVCPSAEAQQAKKVRTDTQGTFRALPIALWASRPVQQWVFHHAQTGIDTSPGPAL